MANVVPVLIFCRRLFLGAVLAYAFASVSFGAARTARPVFYAMTVGWFVLLCWKQASTVRSRTLRCLELLGFNVALTLFVAELSLRAFALLAGNSFLAGDPLGAYRLV